jgi:hypothetical protein
LAAATAPQHTLGVCAANAKFNGGGGSAQAQQQAARARLHAARRQSNFCKWGGLFNAGYGVSKTSPLLLSYQLSAAAKNGCYSAGVQRRASAFPACAGPIDAGMCPACW